MTAVQRHELTQLQTELADLAGDDSRRGPLEARISDLLRKQGAA